MKRNTSRDLVDLSREFNIEIRHPVSIVRGAFHLRIAPAKLNVGMMIHRFGDLADLVDERECLGKIPEFERPPDRVIVKLPVI